ncbi:MAG: trypsin-like peptidase domain-containing protein [Planctomycetota bacterium]
MICRRAMIVLIALWASISGSFLVNAADPISLPADLEHVIAERYPRSIGQLIAIQQQVQRVAKQAMPATVGLTIGHGMGSGVIVSADGLVLTAAHVIGKAGRRAMVELPDGRRLRGRTLGANHEIDAGMIQLVNPPADLPFLPVAKSRAQVGDWVITLGQPGGTVSDRSPPLRLGRVLGGGEDWICTDCTLVGGDSGGPLINLKGEVLAVHSSIGPEIVHNFHIPVVEIEKNWDRLLAGKVWGNELEEVISTTVRPIMGIVGYTSDNRCVITEVYRDLPAYEAGMRAGDVIVQVDGERISSFEQVSTKVRKKKPGQTMQLRVERDGKTFSMEVTLAGLRRPAPPSERDRSDEGEE